MGLSTYLSSPNAQRAIAELAMDTGTDMGIRMAAFEALTDSAKLNGNMLTDATVNAMYTLIQSTETDPALRAATAAAYGTLNLPSQKGKDLILDQARS